METHNNLLYPTNNCLPMLHYTGLDIIKLLIARNCGKYLIVYLSLILYMFCNVHLLCYFMICCTFCVNAVLCVPLKCTT